MDGGQPCSLFRVEMRMETWAVVLISWLGGIVSCILFIILAGGAIDRQEAKKISIPPQPEYYSDLIMGMNERYRLMKEVKNGLKGLE